jgi:antitoxin (DNA-binding transcriptional repressor) of toxin-antitoxin stability system
MVGPSVLALGGQRHNNVLMNTMTATQARQRLGTVLSRALQGEDIGIVHSGTGKIIALRPVEVYSEDHALMEYGITGGDMRKIEKKLLKKAKREKPGIWDGTAASLRH